MTIEPWTGPLNLVDNTFGYNDWLLTPNTAPHIPVMPVDEFSAGLISGTANPSGNLTDRAAETALRPGDRLFRLPNGGIIWRRSIFTDRCPGNGFSPNNVIPMSEDMARAVAYFSRTMVDASWCRPYYAGVVQEGAVRDQVTHWDLTVGSNLQRLQGVIADIRNARANPASARDDLARTLAGTVSATELDSIGASINRMLGENRDAVNRLLNKPWYEQIWDIGPIAVGFALFTGLVHFSAYLALGGQSPLKDFRVLGGIRSIVQGIRDFFNRRPPSDGPGASGNGGGDTNPPPSASGPPPNAAARMSVLPDVASGILAFNGGANPVGATGDGVAPVPSVGVPAANPGVFAVPVIPAPVGVPAPVVAPPVVVPRFVPAL